MSARPEVDAVAVNPCSSASPRAPTSRTAAASTPGLDALFTRYPKQKEANVDESIKVGDVVQLKSGGMHWTVKAISPLASGGEMFAQLLSAGPVGSGHVQRDHLPVVCLVRVHP